MGHYLASLLPERFPHLMASVGELMAADPDERFEFGLELIITGLAATAEPADDGASA